MRSSLVFLFFFLLLRAYAYAYVCVCCVHYSREFRVVLREDPNSIFSPNVQIENTIGPVDYDVSRVYSGTLEGNLFLYND